MDSFMLRKGLFFFKKTKSNNINLESVAKYHHNRSLIDNNCRKCS